MLLLFAVLGLLTLLIEEQLLSNSLDYLLILDLLLPDLFAVIYKAKVVVFAGLPSVRYST